MRSINRRISSIEKKLNVDNKRGAPRVLCIYSPETGETERDLPENVEEWLTFKEQLRENPNTPFFILYSWKELEAKEQAAKGQGNEYKKAD